MADKRKYPEQICPTCALEQPDREPLAFFAGIGVGPIRADSFNGPFWETERLIAFLAAAAAAGPLAVAQHCQLEDSSEAPNWLGNWLFLVEELQGEAQRRLLRLQKAGELWRDRAQEKAA